VRTSGALKTGLDAYINNISYAALDAIYTADEETGATRTLDIELSSGVSFNFGFIGGIGLGFVTTGFNNMFSDPLSLTIAVTKESSGEYVIGSGSTITGPIYDLFDFNYFKTGLASVTAASRSASSIQCGNTMPDSFVSANGNQSGVVVMPKVDLAGTVNTVGRSIQMP